MEFLTNLNPLNKLGLMLFVIVVGVFLYIWFHFIKSGDPLPKDDKDWKKTRDTLVAESLKDLDEFIRNFKQDLKVKQERLDKNLSTMFKQLYNDGLFQWGFILESFKEFGRLINWKKYRAVYCIILLILFGLFLHYVLGV